MNILKNILAIVLGLFIGGAVNMAIIMASGSIIPPPATTMEGLQAAMPLMEPKHFLLPFLAHALGTLVGALIAASIAINYKMRFAMAIGICFLVGGIMNIFMLPSPIWFTIVDLVLAYIPMAYFGGKFVLRKSL